MSKPTWGERASAVWALIGDRPIAYHPMLAKALGNDIPSAIFITQLIYWSDKGTWRPGWTVKTQAEFYDETGLTRYQQERARKKLGKTGLNIVQEQLKGVPARLSYRVRFGNLNNLLAEYMQKHPPERQADQIAENSQTEEEEEKPTVQDAGNSHTGGEKLADQDAGNSQAISETSPETTSPQTTPEKSAEKTAPSDIEIDEVFPETAKAKAETEEWNEPPRPMSPEEAAEMAAPGASADTFRDAPGSHPAYTSWKVQSYRIIFPYGLPWTKFFDYAVLFSGLFGPPIPMNNRDIGQWRVGLVQSISAFGEDMILHKEDLDHERICRRATWGLQALHARRELGYYNFDIVSPTSVAKTLRAIAGDLRRIEEQNGLTDRLPNAKEAMAWYNQQPGAKGRNKTGGAELTEQTLRNMLEGATVAQ